VGFAGRPVGPRVAFAQFASFVVVLIGFGMIQLWSGPTTTALDQWSASGALLGGAIMTVWRARRVLDDLLTLTNAGGELPRHVIE